MFKTLSILSLIILTSSCNRRACPEVSITIDSTVEKELDVQKDTVFTIPGSSLEFRTDLNWIPGLDGTISIAAPAHPTDTFLISQSVKQGTISAMVSLNRKGVLNVNCKTDSLIQRIKWLEKARYSLQFRQSIKYIPGPSVPTPYVPKWVKWALIISVSINAWQFRNRILPGLSWIFSIVKKMIGK